MKKYIVFFVVALCHFMVTCCYKEHVAAFSIDPSDSFPEEKALELFSKALSSAAFESSDLRAFIKEKSLEKFDNDYDVFYHYVCDEKINGDNTFKDVLLNYVSADILAQIENALPLLTIYVPDMRWMGPDEFYAGKWDTESPYVVTTYRFNGKCKNVFAEGEKVEELQSGTFPNCPTLIVKNNERMSVTTDTKSGSRTYSFIDEAFNGIKTKYMHPFEPDVSYWLFDVEPLTNTLSYSELGSVSPLARNSYDYLHEYLNESSQRDYSYYGMTSPSSVGVLNTNVVDFLYRFRMTPASLDNISDDRYASGGGDPYLHSPEISDVDDGGPYTIDNVISNIWGEGSFEIGLFIFWGTDSANAFKQEKYISVAPQDLFQIAKVKKEYWHSTWVKWYQSWRYSVSREDVYSKWFVVDTNVDIISWNVNNSFSEIVLRFFEVDSGTTTTISESFQYKYTASGNVGYEFNNSGHKIALGLSASSEHTKTTSISVSTKQENDPLGDLLINYNTPYIVGQNGSDYTLNALSTGSIVVNILPRNIYE